MISEYVLNTTYIERQIILALSAMLFVLAAVYLYCIAASVTNVVVREEVAQEIAALNSDLSELEATYIDRTNELNLALAREYGFHEVSTQQFVARQPLSGGLSLREPIR